MLRQHVHGLRSTRGELAASELGKREHGLGGLSGGVATQRIRHVTRGALTPPGRMTVTVFHLGCVIHLIGRPVRLSVNS